MSKEDNYYSKRVPTTGCNAPKTSHINLLRGKDHDVMEAAVFKRVEAEEVHFTVAP